MHDKRNILELSKITIKCYKVTTLNKVSCFSLNCEVLLFQCKTCVVTIVDA